jgi:hypothetical protein
LPLIFQSYRSRAFFFIRRAAVIQTIDVNAVGLKFLEQGTSNIIGARQKTKAGRTFDRPLQICGGPDLQKLIAAAGSELGSGHARVITRTKHYPPSAMADLADVAKSKRPPSLGEMSAIWAKRKMGSG